MLVSTGCADRQRQSNADDASVGIDSLNTRIEQAYRARDPERYAALYTDTAVFEWPAIPSVRGRPALAAMVRQLWPGLNDMTLELVVSSRRVAGDQATEFGAFRQSWTDDKGARMTEYGRYVHALARQPDGSWRIDRFAGFEDSLRKVPRAP